MMQTQDSLSALRLVVVLEAVIFCIAATLHTGLRLRAGPFLLALGRILPATIVEGMCGLLFIVAAYAFFSHRPWAWRSTLIAILFSLAGVMVGLSVIATGGGPYKGLNLAYHGVMLVLALTGLTLLLQPGVRVALRRPRQRPKSKVTHAQLS